ncbi:MAG: general secretion pathway protein G [Parcubacteria group bacterium LiPW_30]|jgi:prepilin-type N-terminal cleavage/methylation domain-containing protein|nr:MAG: general secretion pathway protein G [Parcubacteria group bacterium LiPW_30]
MMKTRKSESGFTLVELLVVIAIIGILSSIVLASLNSARAKARDAKRVGDLGSVRTALTLYFDTNKQYPTALSGLVTGGFLAAVPVDPSSTSTPYMYAGLGTGSTCDSYHLGATLEGANDSLASDADASAGTACTGSGADFSGADTPTLIVDYKP